jgi:hypothetical protein
VIGGERGAPERAAVRLRRPVYRLPRQIKRSARRDDRSVFALRAFALLTDHGSTLRCWRRVRNPAGARFRTVVAVSHKAGSHVVATCRAVRACARGTGRIFLDASVTIDKLSRSCPKCLSIYHRPVSNLTCGQNVFPAGLNVVVIEHVPVGM